MSKHNSNNTGKSPTEEIKAAAGVNTAPPVTPEPPVEEAPPAPPVTPEPPVDDLDEDVLDAVIDSVEAATAKEIMEKAVVTCIAGKVNPAYVSEDGNCFEDKNFAFANEHCLKNDICLYRVVYGGDGQPSDLVKMGE